MVARARSDGGVIVAAGGDGTLNTVVQALWEHPIPFGALPRGTFNFFGRQHGLPTDTDAALPHLLAAIEAGADEYVMKPFDRETLESKLQIVGVA